MANQQHYAKLQTMLKELPWYVEEYISHKLRKLSTASLFNYCHDYRIFFTWMINEGLATGSIKEVPLKRLEKMTVQEAEGFLNFLHYELSNKELTINRKLSALKSLFNYLQNVAETKEFEPYINRNVMAKIEFHEVKESMETKANKMEGKILIGDEYENFRLFVAHGYGELFKENKKLFNFHQLNKERDTAIVSLVLGSGLRLSELIGIELDDIDFSKFCVRVMRKGAKEEFVFFSQTALADLKAYLAVRTEKYQVGKENKSLFISAQVGPKGKSRKLTARAVEKLVEKYATAFGKPALSVHKLRHSFATRYHGQINDVPKLKRQLGHSSVQTTMIYTHIRNDELKVAVDKMDMPKES